MSECRGCPRALPLTDRRSFVAQTALAAIGVVLTSSCGDGEIGGPLGPRAAPPLAGPLVIQIADFPALANIGGTARVDPDTAAPVAVTRSGEASFVALSMICPHASFKPIQIVMTGFRCPNHGAEFSELGIWTSGQRTRDLRAYNTAYDEASGTLTIT